jgi:hypothetical protein
MRPVQRSRQYTAIREYTSVKRWDKEARHLAVAAGYAAALVTARVGYGSNLEREQLPAAFVAAL